MVLVKEDLEKALLGRDFTRLGVHHGKTRVTLFANFTEIHTTPGRRLDSVHKIAETCRVQIILLEPVCRLNSPLQTDAELDNPYFLQNKVRNQNKETRNVVVSGLIVLKNKKSRKFPAKTRKLAQLKNATVFLDKLAYLTRKKAEKKY